MAHVMGLNSGEGYRVKYCNTQTYVLSMYSIKNVYISVFKLWLLNINIWQKEKKTIDGGENSLYIK